MNAISQKKKGFTLIEILIVLAIIGIIVLLGTSSYSSARRKVRLDVFTNTVASLITETRDKARIGVFGIDDSPETAQSLCFGMQLNEGAFVDLLSTSYNRLAPNEKCSTASTDIQTLLRPQVESTLVIKQIEQFGNDVQGSLRFFFSPPNAQIEISDLNLLTGQSDSTVRIIIGYENSESELDLRVVRFDVLTGIVFVERFSQ